MGSWNESLADKEGIPVHTHIWHKGCFHHVFYMWQWVEIYVFGGGKCLIIYLPSSHPLTYNFPLSRSLSPQSWPLYIQNIVAAYFKKYRILLNSLLLVVLSHSIPPAKLLSCLSNLKYLSYFSLERLIKLIKIESQIVTAILVILINCN